MSTSSTFAFMPARMMGSFIASPFHSVRRFAASPARRFASSQAAA